MEILLVEQIISGGQTGIDQMALEVARSLGIPTGGVAPKGYRTEIGPDERLRGFGLTEHASSRYAARTLANVVQSDATVLFGDVEEGGTKLTRAYCLREDKRYLINPEPNELRQWLLDHQIRILNVAGSRGSQLSPDQLGHYYRTLVEALRS